MKRGGILSSRRTFVGSAASLFFFPGGLSAWAKDRVFRFGVLSDPHICIDPCSAFFLKKEFERFFRENVRAVIISGDLCEWGTIDELEVLAATWRQVFPDGCNAAGEKVEPVFVFGNHDYHPAEYFASHGLPHTCVERSILRNKDAAWKMLTGRAFEGEIFRRDVAGVTFVGAHWGHYDGELVDWLVREGSKLPTDRPVFLVQHSHPLGTCFGGWYRSSSVENFEALKGHPNFFVISGHSHIANTFEDALWMGGFVSMAAGGASGSGGRRYEHNVAVKRLDVARDGLRHMPAHSSGKPCLSSVVTVTGSEISVSRWDHRHDEPVGDDWQIGFPFRHDPDHPFRIAEQALPPEFPVNAAVSFERCGGVVYPFEAPERQIVFSFPAAVGRCRHSRVADYEVEILDAAAGSSVVKRLVAQEAAACAELRTIAAGARCVFGCDELPVGRRLVVSITPLDVIGKRGKSIRKEFQL